MRKLISSAVMRICAAVIAGMWMSLDEVSNCAMKGLGLPMLCLSYFGGVLIIINFVIIFCCINVTISVSYNMPLNWDDPSDDEEEHVHGEAQAAAQNQDEMTIQNILGCKFSKREISVP
jgi:large-conductance mechanosensitive channel